MRSEWGLGGGVGVGVGGWWMGVVVGGWLVGGAGRLAGVIKQGEFIKPSRGRDGRTASSSRRAERIAERGVRVG